MLAFWTQPRTNPSVFSFCTPDAGSQMSKQCQFRIWSKSLLEGLPLLQLDAKLQDFLDRVLLAPMQHLAYCNLPKAASSTVTTYMTGLNVNIHKFSDVEKFIVERGGDSHFAMVRYSTFHEAGLEHWRNSSAPPYRYFTVVRHPGETRRIYTSPIVPPLDAPEPSPVTRRPPMTHH